jgi:Fic family protein
MSELDQYISERFHHISYRKSWELGEKTLFKLGECSAIVKSIKYLPTSPSVGKELLKVSLIKGAKATTAIEGNTLSEEEVAAIADGEKLPESRRYLETEVKNVIDALNQIVKETVHDNSAEYISADLIRSFHKMIGKELGMHFEAIPGRFRENNVVVGTYRAPEYRFVPELMQRLCAWLKIEFKFQHDAEQDFLDAVIEAIVTHVYIAWIHPFGDGNGRTARLIEFYLLLRGGMPKICSHILSNHYNETRNEYYRQLEYAGKSGRLSDFIDYAVQGFLDGLNDVLWSVQCHQMNNSWRNYVYEIFDTHPKINKPKRNRMRSLVLNLEFFKEYSFEELRLVNVDLAAQYKILSSRTINRDVADLKKMGLMEKKGDKYLAQISSLVSQLPKKRTVLRKSQTIY